MSGHRTIGVRIVLMVVVVIVVVLAVTCSSVFRDFNRIRRNAALWSHLRSKRALVEPRIPDHESEETLGERIAEQVFDGGSQLAIRGITLDSRKLDDRDWEVIRACQDLEYLSLVRSNFTDADAAHVTNFEKLEGLFLSATEITDAGVKTICQVTTLRRLSLSHTTIGDESVSSLARLANVEILCINNTRVSRAEYDKLSEALPGCRIEWCEPRPPRQYETLRQLYKLHASYSTSDGEECVGLANYSGTNSDLSLLKDVGRVTRVYCIWPDIDEEGIANIGRCPTLVSLDLDAGAARDELCPSVAKITQLTDLRLGLGITDEGVAHIVALQNLERVALFGPGMTSESLKHLARLPKLKSLTYYGTAIDEGDPELLKLFPASDPPNVR